MGRDCGYLALASYLTSGAELCLIPELPYKLEDFEANFKQQVLNGRRYFIAVVAEGIQQDSQEIAQWFEDVIGIESRVIVLGHIQRGGNPSVYDRLMAYKFVTHAIDTLLEAPTQSIICYDNTAFTPKSVHEVTQPYTLDKNLLNYLKETLYN